VLYPPQDSAIRPLVARMLIAQGVRLFAGRIETASAAFGRALTLSDPGVVWFISRGVVAADLDAGTLVRLDLDTGQTLGAVGIMTRADEVPAPAARAFCLLLAAAGRPD
jgi:LysR family pca operon transcriptional activator